MPEVVPALHDLALLVANRLTITLHDIPSELRGILRADEVDPGLTELELGQI